MNSSFREERRKESLQLLKLITKCSKRGFLLSLILGTIICIFVTSFGLLWFASQHQEFNKFMSYNNNWLDDEQISSSYSTIHVDFIPNYSSDYLEKIVYEMSNDFKNIYQLNLSDDYIASMILEVYVSSETIGNNIHSELMTLNNESENVLKNSLVSGRMPLNSTEILFFKQIDSTNNFSINDQITIQPDTISGNKINLTIVGIIENFEGNLSSHGFSTDILNWQEHIVDHRYVFLSNEIFITNSLFFFELANDFQVLNNGRVVLIDFNYQFDDFNVRKLKNSLSKHQSYINNKQFLDAEPIAKFVYCNDLYSSLVSFDIYWSLETIKVSSLTLPLVFVLFFICNEIFNSNKSTIELTIKKLKIIGIRLQEIRKALLIKDLVIACSSIVGGILLGTIIGLIVAFSSNNYNIIFVSFVGAFSEPFFAIMLGIVFIMIFIGGFLIENKLTRRTGILSNNHQKNKDKSKWRNFFSLQGIITLIPGLVILFIGIMLVLIFPIENDSINNTMYVVRNLLSTLAWSLIYLSAFFLLLSLFFFSSQITTYLVTLLGKNKWQNQKNKFTYALKNIAINKNNYLRLMIISFIICIGIFPGITLKRSINNHIDLESNLTIGCADLAIMEWNGGILTKGQIESINGIELSSLITNYYIVYDDLSNENYPVTYVVILLAIHNTTEFIETVDISKLGKIPYTQNDVLALEQNLTYLMNKEHVKKYGYDQTTKLTNKFFGTYSLRHYLEYINSFEVFPALPFFNDIQVANQQIISFNLVTSLNTASILENSSINSNYEKEQTLLIKSSSDANLTSIYNILRNHFGSNVQSYESTSRFLRSNINEFVLNLPFWNAFFLIILCVIYGYLTANNVYSSRKRIIETEYRLGIDRRSIWWGISLEVLSIIIMPILISAIIGSLSLIILDKIIISIIQNFVQFKIWLPWWLYIITPLLALIVILGGWFIGIIPLVNNYRPIKVE